MFEFDNLEPFNTRLSRLREQRYEESPDKFPYCKNQDSFCKKMFLEGDGNREKRRQTLGRWESGNTHPRVPEILMLCKLLECDPNYLLGYGKAISKDIGAVSAFTGLERKSIETLRENTDFINFLNYLITSDSFPKLVSSIEKDSIYHHIDNDLTSSYKTVLLKRMRMAFDNALALSSPFDDLLDFYKRELSLEISGFRKRGIENGILIHVSESIRNEILRAKSEREIPDESDEYYSLVIDFLAEFSCDPFSYENECEQRNGRLAQMFIDLLNGYFAFRTNQRRERMREYAKQRQQV